MSSSEQFKMMLFNLVFLYFTRKVACQESPDYMGCGSMKYLNPEGNPVKLMLQNLKSQAIGDFAVFDSEASDHLKISKIDTFNNHLHPRLQSIVQLEYFRFVKLNLYRKCLLWPDSNKCSLKDCGIESCDESELPPHVLADEMMPTEDECSASNRLSEVDDTVSLERVETLNSLFECTELDNDGTSSYFDLLLNPEGYTGYKGETANRIWRSIYEENCFLQRQQKTPFSFDNLCYEERLFYRAISGLHSSINIQLSGYYQMLDGTFGPNLNEFEKKFGDKSHYLSNLYFLYLIELRALHKSEPYLMNKVNWLSNGDQSQTKDAIRNLFKTIKSFKWHFNESTLFKQEPGLAQEFAEHFHNITTNIMNCVACDKCRLWGKVQTHGLGTAFKILLTENVDKLILSRHEIITLMNSVARLSNSIYLLEVFNRLMPHG